MPGSGKIKEDKMKGKICLVVLVIIGLITTSAYAEIKNVLTPDFQGIKNIDLSGETDEGKWVITSGGTFEGTATIRAFNVQAWQEKMQKLTIKISKLEEQIYNLTAKEAELRARGMVEAADALLRKIAILRDKLASLNGMLSDLRAMQVNLNGSREVRKEGKLTTPTFKGVSYYQEIAVPNGTSNSEEVLDGKEILGNGGVFEGTKDNTRRSDNSSELRKEGRLTTPTFKGVSYYREITAPDGTANSEEVLDGIWNIAPNLKLSGSISIQRQGNGEPVIRDERRQIPEKPPIPPKPAPKLAPLSASTAK